MNSYFLLQNIWIPRIKQETIKCDITHKEFEKYPLFLVIWQSNNSKAILRGMHDGELNILAQ